MTADAGGCPPGAECGCRLPRDHLSRQHDVQRNGLGEVRDVPVSGRPVGGDQILRGSTLREMQRVHWLDPSWQQGWGLGFKVIRQAARPTSDTAVRRRGIARRCCSVRPTRPRDRAQQRARLRLAALLRPCLPVGTAAVLRTAAPEPPRAAPDPRWQRYIGRYRDAWSDTQVLVRDGELVIIDPAADDPLDTMATLTPVAEHVFRYESSDGSSSRGELAVFEVDDTGHGAAPEAGRELHLPGTTGTDRRLVARTSRRGSPP